MYGKHHATEMLKNSTEMKVYTSNKPFVYSEFTSEIVTLHREGEKHLFPPHMVTYDNSTLCILNIITNSFLLVILIYKINQSIQ